MRRILTVAVVLGWAVAACSNATETSGGSGDGPVTTAADGGESERDTFEEISGVPGVTDDAIAYAVVGTKEGNPLGTCILDCYLDGIEAYFAYRNSEGGIYGRDLVVGDVLDDALGENQARALDVISSDDAFGSFQATLLATGWGDLDQAGIPTYAWGIHATEYASRPSIFPSVAVRCTDCDRPIVTWAALQAGASKVASIGYGATDNSKDCTTSTADGVERLADDTGVEVVYVNDDLEYGLPNGLGPEVTAMKDAGVDFISTCVDLNGMQTLARELDRQGMGDVVLFHPNTYDHAFIAENAQLFEGDYVNVQFRPFEAASEGSALADFEEWMDETGSERTELAMVGWINATLAFDGLLAAGPDFDRATVISATSGFTDYTGGGLLVPIDWGDAHTPYTAADPDPDVPECSAVVKVEDGELAVVTDAEAPWLCWDPEADGWSEPEQTNFE